MHGALVNISSGLPPEPEKVAGLIRERRLTLKAAPRVSVAEAVAAFESIEQPVAPDVVIMTASALGGRQES